MVVKEDRKNSDRSTVVCVVALGACLQEILYLRRLFKVTSKSHVIP